MKEGRTIMLCHLARRAISRSEDRGKALPRWAGRHIGRCEACREYALGQVDSQRRDFRRLGVLGDWERPYLEGSDDRPG